MANTFSVVSRRMHPLLHPKPILIPPPYIPQAPQISHPPTRSRKASGTIAKRSRCWVLLEAIPKSLPSRMNRPLLFNQEIRLHPGTPRHQVWGQAISPTAFTTIRRTTLANCRLHFVQARGRLWQAILRMCHMVLASLGDPQLQARPQSVVSVRRIA